MSATPSAQTASSSDVARRATRSGLISGLAAYTWWGIIPLYFKLLLHVPATAVLAHRVIWSAAFLAIVVTFRRDWTVVLSSCRSQRTWLVLSATTLLIAGNWLTFILSVQLGRVLDASLGFFIAPLVSVLLGVIFLHEKLRVAQAVAVVLATVGATVLAVDRGVFPWIALALAGTSGFYGLLRKIAPVGPLVGLLVETSLLAPVAAAALLVFPAQLGLQNLQLGGRDWLLLVLCGAVTAIPLLLYTDAARKLKLTTFGFLQYIGPTLQFLLAVLLFREPFGAGQAITFALIWTAIGIYVADSVRAQRVTKRSSETRPGPASGNDATEHAEAFTTSATRSPAVPESPPARA